MAADDGLDALGVRNQAVALRGGNPPLQVAYLIPATKGCGSGPAPLVLDHARCGRLQIGAQRRRDRGEASEPADLVDQVDDLLGSPLDPHAEIRRRNVAACVPRLHSTVVVPIGNMEPAAGEQLSAGAESVSSVALAV